jgi:hypothetical protein
MEGTSKVLSTAQMEREIIGKVCAIPIEKWSHTMRVSGRDERVTNEYRSKLGKTPVSVTIAGQTATHDVGGLVILAEEKDFRHVVEMFAAITRNGGGSNRQLQVEETLKEISKPAVQKKIRFEGEEQGEA